MEKPMEITFRFVKTAKKYQHYEVVGSDAVGQVYIVKDRLALPPAQLAAVIELPETETKPQAA
jgi:hypothetical protein